MDIIAKGVEIFVEKLKMNSDRVGRNQSEIETLKKYRI
jgi:hypothetical protein